MSFTTALLVIVGIGAIVLGLVCNHLLSRLELLESAVAGGLEAPTRRLGADEFELRFATALLRHRLARAIGTGVVIGLDPAHGGELLDVVRELPRTDGFVLAVPSAPGRTQVTDLVDRGMRVVALDDFDLAPPTLPFVYVVADGRVVTAQPVGGPDDLLRVLEGDVATRPEPPPARE